MFKKPTNYLMIGKLYVAPFFVGFLIGYLFYDMTQYAVHHFNLKSKFWLALKHHHMIHHYKDDHNGYGVSSKFWDLVFKTATFAVSFSRAAATRSRSPYLLPRPMPHYNRTGR